MHNSQIFVPRQVCWVIRREWSVGSCCSHLAREFEPCEQWIKDDEVAVAQRTRQPTWARPGGFTFKFDGPAQGARRDGINQVLYRCHTVRTLLQRCYSPTSVIYTNIRTSVRSCRYTRRAFGAHNYETVETLPSSTSIIFASPISAGTAQAPWL